MLPTVSSPEECFLSFFQGPSVKWLSETQKAPSKMSKEQRCERRLQETKLWIKREGVGWGIEENAQRSE